MRRQYTNVYINFKNKNLYILIKLAQKTQKR